MSNDIGGIWGTLRRDSDGYGERNEWIRWRDVNDALFQAHRWYLFMRAKGYSIDTIDHHGNLSSQERNLFAAMFDFLNQERNKKRRSLEMPHREKEKNEEEAIIKELRKQSYACTNDCREALVKCNWDIEAALKWLKEKNIVTCSGGNTMSESKSWFYSVTDIDGNEHHFPIVNITRLVWEPSSKGEALLYLVGVCGGIRIYRDSYIKLLERMATVEVRGES